VLLVTLVASEQARGDDPFPVLGHQRLEGANPGFESPRCVAVAVSFEVFTALVGRGAKVLGDLGF
jgi:hypothetical protein